MAVNHDAPAAENIRWAFNVSAWTCTEAELAFLLSMLPADDRQLCQSFKNKIDVLRALISRLMQRACVSNVLGMPWADVDVKMTKGRKPFVANAAAQKRLHAPNFNYNVSHEGHYVCIASDTHLLVGVDVAAPQQLRRAPDTPGHSVLKRFRNCFADNEWELLNSWPGDDRKTEACFQKLWSLKEVSHMPPQGHSCADAMEGRIIGRLGSTSSALP